MDRDRTHGASYPEDFAGKDYGYGYSSGYESGRKDASAPLEARIRELEEGLREIDSMMNEGYLQPVKVIGYVKQLLSSSSSDGWIDCKERLPDYDNLVLWYREDGNSFTAMLDKDGNHWLTNPDINGVRVTHWRELPKPPNTI